MLDDLKLIHTRDSADLLGKAQKFWQLPHDSSWLPTIPTRKNLAKQLALETLGRSVVIIAEPALLEVANHWKASFNRYAKQLAWVSDITNGDELVAWTGQPIEKSYAVLELRHTSETPEIEQQYAQAERYLSGKRPSPVVVRGEETWLQALSTFAALYTAIASGIDPSSYQSFLHKFNLKE